MQIDQNSTFGDAGATYTTQLDKTKLTSKDKIRVFMGGNGKLYTSDDIPCGSVQVFIGDADVTVAAVLKETVVVDPNAAEKLKGPFTDGANDNAVAFKKTYTAADLTGKTGMLLKAKIDGKEYPYRKGTVLSLPNLDGDVTSLTLGIVIQYADAEVNVESLAIELQ